MRFVSKWLQFLQSLRSWPSSLNLAVDTTYQLSKLCPVSSTGLVTIYDLKLSAFNVFVESKDGTNLKDKVTIKKPESNESNFGDDFYMP